jgi:hypothetical protein
MEEISNRYVKILLQGVYAKKENLLDDEYSNSTFKEGFLKYLEIRGAHERIKLIEFIEKSLILNEGLAEQLDVTKGIGMIYEKAILDSRVISADYPNLRTMITKPVSIQS